MKNTIPFGLVIITILFLSIRFCRARALSKSNEDALLASKEDGYYSKEKIYNKQKGYADITHTKSYLHDYVKDLDLKLDGPLLDPVEYACPKSCQCSNGTFVVNCSNLRLIKIPKGIPKNVHTLILSDNSLNIIEAGAFSELTDIHEIILTNNQIKNIENSAFSIQLVNLDHVDLSFNQLTKLDPEVFVHLPKLRKLSLNNNNLTILENEMLLKQNKLEELNLADCNINQLYDSTFSYLQGLQRLQLAKNPLEEEMDLNIFDPIKKIQYLSMPQLNEDTIFKLCKKLISIDVINFDTFDVSCFELVSGQTFEESVVTIKTQELEMHKNEQDAFNIIVQEPIVSEVMIVTEATEESVTAWPKLKIEQQSTSIVNDVKKDYEISLSYNEMNISSTQNKTSAEDEPPKEPASVSADTINKMLIGIIIIAVCGLVIGVICRRDCCGIKTKMCRTRRSIPTDRTHTRPSEEVPLNKITNNQQQ